MRSPADALPLDRDTLDLLRAFCAREVRFLVVGAHALGYWAAPRATGDLDLWIDPEPANARRAYLALADFGAPMESLTVADLETPGVVFQMGVAPRRIDIMTALTGVDFADGWEGHAVVDLLDLSIPVIARHALARNKRATGRAKDLLDLRLLEEE